jgi:hypothetical protein
MADGGSSSSSSNSVKRPKLSWFPTLHLTSTHPLLLLHHHHPFTTTPSAPPFVRMEEEMIRL